MIKYILLFLLIPSICFAALDTDTIFEFRSTATANMVNGGGFNSTNATPGTDYSTQDAAHLTITDLVIGNPDNTTVTSVLTPFDSLDPGNILHITAGTGFTTGWYEVVSVSGSTATLDRACGTAGSTGGTAYLGGALNVGGSLEDDFFEQCVAGNIVYFYGAVTYTPSEAISILTDGTSVLPITVEGYNTTRGDDPTGTNRPTLALGATELGSGDYFKWKNLIMTATSAVAFRGGAGSVIRNIKFTNSSVSADRYAFYPSTGIVFNCEGISTNGYAIGLASLGGKSVGNYFHDSKNGIYLNSDDILIAFNISETNTTNAVLISATADVNTIINNTLYGAETPTGTGINISGGISPYILNNIIYGFVTGISQTATDTMTFLDYNDFFNNTTDVSNVTKGENDIALNPTFTDAANADFRIGTNLKALGFPGAFQTGLTTGYIDIGAVQRQEPSGTGGGSSSLWINN